MNETMKPSYLYWWKRITAVTLFDIFIVVLSVASISYEEDFRRQGITMPSMFIFIATLSISMFIGIISLWWERTSNKFTIVGDLITHRSGIISRNEKQVLIKNITGINVKQGPIERMFGVGSVEFSTSSTGGIEVVFEGIKYPVVLRDKVNAYIDAV